jgi:hypothetical protein
MGGRLDQKKMMADQMDRHREKYEAKHEQMMHTSPRNLDKNNDPSLTPPNKPDIRDSPTILPSAKKLGFVDALRRAKNMRYGGTGPKIMCCRQCGLLVR